MIVKFAKAANITYKTTGGNDLKKTTMGCARPNCNCLEIAEEKAGGPVKSYPCLANDFSEQDEKEKLKQAKPIDIEKLLSKVDLSNPLKSE